ncbi:carbon-nitrogen hydrolase family protein [Microbulbifer thermotolerans]|uniref:Hydrolase n=1 Tax=Microbulbifer thermotolerans TaxID=252514 RepID=A0A143HQ26_MICTH|nr:carbon-nitrogen hydrolase family protein [Microbulbifer thermotolerans]AMX03601.1 hydrolase [Microbulbifer thermotolerans]MCX2781035.1 carbon-nitrogen hydrolase family protein [Microbulbifer thermotolerans]MCX2782138.1 carbon-nitrogen hydrolase family protein [Microbulbifer thermotolerans]MCX2796060.1 carbon-nitrogen hydrolase family protein [Microbulbifer thermotolerans]MCX2801202.1 carbon-nitrogen hydrolase family protein [Microbulbifer thermotolerans]
MSEVNKYFGIAALQLNLADADNLERLLERIQKTKLRFPWVQMIVLSELALRGVGVHHARELPSDEERAFCRVARELGIWLVPGSMYEKCGSTVFNTAPVINPQGEVVGRYRKIYPFLPYEKGVTGGDQFLVFDIPEVGRFGVSICYDIWFPETTRALTWMGAEVIIHPTKTDTIDRAEELAIVRASAVTNQCYIVDVNSAGNQGVGRSIIVGPEGEVIYEASVAEEVITFEVDLAKVRQVREHGVKGLGQTLKSFRDGKVRYPQYEPGAFSPAYEALGPLKARD